MTIRELSLRHTAPVETPGDPRLYALVERVIVDALRRLRGLHDDGVRFDRFAQYPTFDDGDASVFRRVAFSSGPHQHRSVFGPEAAWGVHVLFEELDGFPELLTYVESHPTLVEFLAPSRIAHVIGRRGLAISVADLPLEIVDRIANLAEWDADPDRILELYRPLEKWWLEHDSLPAELVVPILALSFEDERIELGDGAYIERMTDGTQLARVPNTPGWRDRASALACATHALVLPEQTIGGANYFAWLSPVEKAPFGEVELFFESLAVVANTHSGYGQAFYRPLGWAIEYRGLLPALVQGPLVQRYPRRLDGGLQHPDEILPPAAADVLVRTYRALASANKTVRLASQRLLGASRREDDADRILDLCIGIEALVSDSVPGDTTYKIAMRTAAAVAPELDPTIAASSMRAIYRYRSAVVHGSPDAERRRSVALRDVTVPADGLADLYLRRLLSRFIDDPALTPQGLDDLILRRLAEVPEGTPE